MTKHRLKTSPFLAVAVVAALGMGLTACGGSGSSDSSSQMQETPDPALGAAKMAAAAAATAAAEAASAAATAASDADQAAMDAEQAATDAEAAADAQTANMGADEASYAVARDAARRARAAAGDARMAADDADAAKAAADAAKAAADAAKAEADEAETVAAAQAARDKAIAAQGDAETAQGNAETAMAASQDKQGDAETEQANAERYAGMVAAAQQAIDDENQRVMDVASARTEAMQSYMAADAAATKAEQAADDAEETASGSQGAVDARKAATAARTAANAAKMAHDAITDGMTTAEANAQAAEAATQAGNANSSYMAAKLENDAIQTAALIGKQQQEARDLANAREDAGMYADEVKTHYDAAKGKAADARAQADAARAAADKAKAARTDYANADKYAKMAEAEATKAETARDAAAAAHMAAEAARMAADDAQTSMAARAEADKAKAQNVIATEAHTGDTGAGMAYMAASDAANKATGAARVHVLGLLRHANGSDITFVGTEDDIDTAKALADARKDRLGLVVGVIEEAADGANNINGTIDAVNGSTAMATWPRVPDNPTTDDDESAGNVLMIQVDPDGDGALETLLFRTKAADEDDTDTADIDETIVTATRLDRGLGGFYGYSISDRGTHAIVFTDKTQDAAPVTEVTPLTASAHANLTVDIASHTITDLGTKSGDTYTGVTFYEAATVDVTAEDHDAGTAFMGSLTCPDGVTCNLQTDADGDLTDITGYQFTGSRAARAAVTEMTATQQAEANADYLTFGVWLQQDTNGDTEGTPKAFAAFADGGSPVTDVTYGGAVVTGSATYNGKAAGVYTAGKSVDWFEGNATLTANFGNKPQTGEDTVLGTITGMIDGIVAGGNEMDDVILLNDDGTPDDGNITATGGITGDARMGTASTVDNVTTYTHNGSWSGQFYNGTADVAATTDVDEKDVPPGSVAGTFGVSGINDMGTPDDKADDVTRSYVGAFGAHKQ